MRNKELLTALMFDMKEGFDRLTENKLINQIRKPSILLSLIKWLVSFHKK